MFNAIFNNISAISWSSVLLVWGYQRVITNSKSKYGQYNDQKGTIDTANNTVINKALHRKRISNTNLIKYRGELGCSGEGERFLIHYWQSSRYSYQISCGKSCTKKCVEYSELQALAYRIKWEINIPNAGAAGMLLHINGKFSVGKFKSSILS